MSNNLQCGTGFVVYFHTPYMHIRKVKIISTKLKHFVANEIPKICELLSY